VNRRRISLDLIGAGVRHDALPELSWSRAIPKATVSWNALQTLQFDFAGFRDIFPCSSRARFAFGSGAALGEQCTHAALSHAWYPIRRSRFVLSGVSSCISPSHRSGASNSALVPAYLGTSALGHCYDAWA